jgi:hypothetical protein
MAAIDFPAAPADGQSFVAGNGIVYQWSAAKSLWLASPPSGGVTVPTYDSRNDATSDPTFVPFDDSIPQITEGSRLFQRVFTAVDPSHPIEVDADAVFAAGGVALNISMSLFVDGGPSAVMTKVVSCNAQWFAPCRLRWIGTLPPGAHTFEVRWGAASASYINRNDSGRLYGGALTETMTIREIGIGPQGPQGPAGPPSPFASCFATVSGGVVTIQKASNISSITRPSAGVFEIAMTAAAADLNYRVQFAQRGGSNSYAGELSSFARTPTNFRVFVGADNVGSTDPAGLNITVWS